MDTKDRDFIPRTLTLIRPADNSRRSFNMTSINRLLTKTSGRRHLSRPKHSAVLPSVLTLKETEPTLDHPHLNFRNLENQEQKKNSSAKSIQKRIPPQGALRIPQDLVKLSDFRQGHKVGEGSYSVVKLFHKDNKKYACKIFKKPLSPQMIDIIRKEVEILRGLDNRNIVRLHYYFQDTHHIYLVLEYVQGKTLVGLLKKILSEAQVKHLFKQLVEAVGYLHSRNVSHRDLKLDNIMIEDVTNRIVIIDFGFGSTSTKKLKMYCGTPSYMCPQIVNRCWYSGAKADVWALGVILYKMLTGNFPFKGMSELDVFGKICKCKFPKPQKCSKQVLYILGQMVCKHQEDRVTCPELLQLKWFS